MGFAEKAKALMEKEKITQAKLAELTGISPSTISRYLSGEISPKESVAEQLLSALGATNQSMMEDEGMLSALNLVRETYEGRISDLKADLRIEKREKWIFVVLLMIVVSFVFLLLYIDIANGKIGWFRY